MSRENQPTSSLYTQVDITSAGQTPQPQEFVQNENSRLLRDILESQDRSNELLEELISAMGSAQKQRATELNQWKQANSELSKSCREAADGLSQVQVQFLKNMTQEVNDSVEELSESDFMLNEFVDRYGPRLAHLNGVIQVLAQLSAVPNPTDIST